MGFFDSVHTGTRCGQTKALGKNLGNIRLGDPAQVYPASTAAAMGDVVDAEAQAEDEHAVGVAIAQVAMQEGGYLVIRDGVLAGWDETPHADLPMYDCYGARLEAAPEPSEYLHAGSRWYAELAEQERTGKETSADQLLSTIMRLPNLEDLIAGSEEYTARLEQIQQDARIRMDQLNGLPGSCTICAEVRAAG